MKFKSSKIIDFFLLQKDFYSKLTDKSMWLYIGIIFVGIRDVVFEVMGMSTTNAQFRNTFHFNVKTAGILLITVLIIGIVDTVSFSYPVFDIIKHFLRKNDTSSMSMGMSYSSILTKVTKVYVLANVIITPLDILTYFTNSITISKESVIFMYITLVLGILAYFWFNGAITRGLCVLFKLPNSVRGLVFVLVFFWNALISSAVGYLLDQVLTRL